MGIPDVSDRFVALARARSGSCADSEMEAMLHQCPSALSLLARRHNACGGGSRSRTTLLASGDIARCETAEDVHLPQDYGTRPARGGRNAVRSSAKRSLAASPGRAASASCI
ncbi:hypothetical protein BD311DRAFT_753981 [Dichomitus squalens]|uniref:Uncharacterized protein n=1 Tax=Dichomitus squalens TaxID=114155 RepID=A0A4Q9MUI9_9APHY|nr:hypothetical protein BD311DRAFT_753981 [Dichomitus squalens]